MKLSERISSGDISQEVVYDVAATFGWQFHGYRGRTFTQIWCREHIDVDGCPNYLTDIRLTFADIKARGWHWLKCLDERGHTMFAIYDDAGSELGREIYTTSDEIAAITALLRALGE